MVRRASWRVHDGLRIVNAPDRRVFRANTGLAERLEVSAESVGSDGEHRAIAVLQCLLSPPAS
jgi:hypothetical protein